ncbi:S-layer homology domain-containing protein [Tumebacillus permanentifrigoris]|uniref:S-layer family protein n=1 Tax=Tumebacillus permanentifrigoris TaxID=378543 RepID=A0A316D3P3_9BACL|nr:S-layer homology domain-containing protein [Tumebacillus permanentifrigoris]PWK04936.1 S-layer family protein [Tumebacillus permanentifrigoris]
MSHKKWSKLLASTIVLSSVFSPLAAVATTPTAGAQVATGLEDALQQARELGLLVGDPNGEIRPNDHLTRMELAKIFCSLFQLNIEQVQSPSFADVSSNDWGLNYIEAVRKAGLMTGDGRTFRPNDLITREEMAVVLVRGLGLDAQGAGSQLKIADKSEISTWAQDAVQTVLDLGLMQASGNTFSPQQALIRQEVATVAVGVVDRPTGHVHVADGTVTIAGISYQVSESLQGLLSSTNSDVLQHARFELERDGYKIIGIKRLELQQQEGVLDAKNNVLSGSLVLKGSVTLKNLTAKGTVQVTGTAAQQGHVILENTTLASVAAKDAQVTARGTTKIADTVVNGKASITVEGNASIDKLQLAEGAGEVQLKGKLLNVVLQGNAHAKITLLDGASIQNLTLPAGVATRDLFNQYDAIKASIPMVNGSTNVDLRVYVTSNPPQVQVDRAALNLKIITATAFKNAAEVGTTPGTVPQAAYDALVQAIADATAVQNNATATQTQVDAAVTTLEQAIATFQASINQGVNTQALLAKIADATAVLGSAVVGNTTGTYPQSAIDVLTQAIATAQGFADQVDATQEQVDSAAIALTVAVTQFQQAQLAPLTVTLTEGARLDINSALGGTSGDVVLTDTQQVPFYQYNKRNIKNLIQIKRGAEVENIKYVPGTTTFEVDNAQNEKIAELSLASSTDLIQLAAATSGVNLHPQPDLTEATSGNLVFTVTEAGQVAGQQTLSFRPDETAPVLTGATYANDLFTFTASEGLATFMIPPVIQVEASTKGDFLDTISLVSGSDYSLVGGAVNSQFQIRLTGTGKSKLTIQQGSKFRFTINGYYDFANNAMNTSYLVDVDQL